MIICLTPAIGWSWPALVPIVTSAAALMGFERLTGRSKKDWLRGKLTPTLENLRTVIVPLSEIISDVVAEEIGREERLDFKKGDMLLTFRKDVRGKFIIEVTGAKTSTRMDLLERGREFAMSLVQQFAHNKIAKELDRRGVQIVEEEVNENGDIVLITRRWN